MAQTFDGQPGDLSEEERARLDQEEMARQLGSPAASASAPGQPGQPPAAVTPATPDTSSFPYTPPAAGQDLANGFKEKHASQYGALSGAASGASLGAKVGSFVPGLGTLAGAGIGAGVGALVGWAKGRKNDSKNEREQFAQGMGLPNTTALWSKLAEVLPADQANELKDRALNRIGKHDMTADQQWMQDVTTALQNAPQKGAAAGDTTPGAVPAAAAAPVTPGAVTGAPTTGPAAGGYKTQLMEGDPGKLADTAHAAESPKYDFLQLAQQNKYDYTQMPQMLDALKSGPNGRLWQGWQADGKGNFVFAGDPKQLAPEWKGATRVDAVGGYGNLANGGQAAGWRWGVDGPAGSDAPSGTPGMGGPTSVSGINSLVPTDTNFYNTLQSRLAAILGGPQAFDREALLAQLSGK